MGDDKADRINRWLEELESAVGTLPSDYKAFIRAGDFSRIPGPDGVSFSLLEPDPFGGGGVLEFFLEPNPREIGYFEDVQMLVIGSNTFDYPVCMSLQEECRGSLYYYDHEQRALRDDAWFRMMFENLAPSIERYLEQRREGNVPPKAEGMESFYKIAESFSDFLAGCVPVEEEE